jgi:hypothetical protein
VGTRRRHCGNETNPSELEVEQDYLRRAIRYLEGNEIAVPTIGRA